MEHLRNWLLPIVLGAGWLALSPIVATSLDQSVSSTELVAGGAATAVAAIALGFRRRAPLTTLGVVTAVVIIGHFATPRDSLTVLPAEMVALYSVAVRCLPAVGLRAAGALFLVQTSASLGLFGFGEDFALEVSGNFIAYLVIMAAGRNRRRRVAEREHVSRQLRDAEKHRQDAAAAERRRLARELHDVSAHHLTSIVVSGTAAERLGDRRPELSSEALTYAVRTGQETLTSLRRLVAVLETGEREQSEPLGGRITDLAEAFTRLGQQVVVDVVHDLPGPVADAVFGIVRESLTNTLRHAPGAAIRVLVTRAGDRVDVLVENGRATGTPSAGAGSRRGIAGMKARAEAAGGKLTAGPGPDGGWQVRATFASPSRTAALPSVVPLTERYGVTVGIQPHHGRLVPSNPEPRWRDRWLTELGVVLAVAVPAVGGAVGFALDGPSAPDTATISLAVLVAVIPALILLGRRERPWTVLAFVAVAELLWPLAVGLGRLPDETAPAMMMGIAAPAVAVYAVAAHGAQEPGESWPSVLAAASGFGIAAGGLMAITSPDEPSPLGFAVFAAVAAAVAVGIPLFTCWGAGAVVRRRRIRRSDRAGETLANLVRAAEAEVHAERQRIATGLHRSVLTRTGELIALAETGQLTGATSAARAALGAMRDLLETLDEDGTTAPRAPQPPPGEPPAPQPTPSEPRTPPPTSAEPPAPQPTNPVNSKGETPAGGNPDPDPDPTPSGEPWTPQPSPRDPLSPPPTPSEQPTPPPTPSESPTPPPTPGEQWAPQSTPRELS